MDFAKLIRVTQNSYDYIIAGSGMAGLSLAFYLNESPLRDKKILIIDRDSKSTNDHTWCFWEKEKSAFEEIISHQWKNVWFHGTNEFSRLLNLGEYEYKMIHAEDFYRFIKTKISTNSHISFLQASIKEIISNENHAVVKTENGDFTAQKFAFDSFTRKAYDNPKYQNLWQHFAGWTIETDEAVFNPNEPTLFDFRVEQKNECRFIYILPFSEKKALIEFTVFSDNILEKNEYELYLKKYIAETLKIEEYKIIETESGVIPMSDEPHLEIPSPKIVRIGTAGGYVKSSTGYSFERTQRRLQKLVKDLIESDSDFDKFTKIDSSRKKESYIPTWKSYLDSVLLNVLKTKKHPAADVFTHLFQQNPTPLVLKFLNEDTSLAEDLRIMKTVPLLPFTRAAIESAAKKVRL